MAISFWMWPSPIAMPSLGTPQPAPRHRPSSSLTEPGGPSPKLASPPLPAPQEGPCGCCGSCATGDPPPQWPAGLQTNGAAIRVDAVPLCLSTTRSSTLDSAIGHVVPAGLVDPQAGPPPTSRSRCTVSTLPGGPDRPGPLRPGADGRGTGHPGRAGRGRRARGRGQHGNQRRTNGHPECHYY